MGGHYPIRTAARMTGLTVDTLRAWERRYHAVTPDRGDRGRVYRDRHIARLRLLASLVAEGHAIGSIGGQPDAALQRLRTVTADHAPASAPPGLNLDPLFRAMKQYDLEAIDAHLTRHALLLTPPALIFGVVLPVLQEAGSRWAAGTLSPAHEHLASGIIRGVLGGLLRSLPRARPADRIVFATPAGERHELGLLCGAVLAASAGYSPAYLGPDLPAAAIAQAARQAEAKALVLSGTASGVDYRELRSLKRLPDRIAVWVGGARAADLRSAIGTRARLVNSLEHIRGLLDRHVA